MDREELSNVIGDNAKQSDYFGKCFANFSTRYTWTSLMPNHSVLKKITKRRKSSPHIKILKNVHNGAVQNDLRREKPRCPVRADVKIQ